ncbi:major facilitator superfamily domain-containing protein [Geopyxis carbonaria]|nr:major facilitator superfamily domain-containing protein [Geopyxis carbonaria]
MQPHAESPTSPVDLAVLPTTEYEDTRAIMKRDDSHEHNHDDRDNDPERGGSASFKYAEDPNLVTWSPGGDPENPREWPAKKKSLVVLALCMGSMCVAMSPTIFAPAIFSVRDEFNVSTEVATLGLSMTVLGWACGPLVFSPMSEIWGRNTVYIPTWFLFAAFTLGAALVKNIGGFLVCRLLVGIFGSPMVAMVPASAYDMFPPDSVGPPSFMLAISALLGSTLGQVFGGFITQYAGWRWTMWVMLIFTGALLLNWTWIPETHAATVLARKAARLRKQTGNADLHTEFDRHALRRFEVFQTAIWRPLQLLTLEPIVMLASVVLGFVWGVLYLYLATYIVVFRTHYGFGAGNSGAAFGGIAVGVLLAVFAAPSANKIYLALSAKHGNGKVFPEGRLPPAMFATLLIPASIFWFAWTGRSDVHWIVPVLSGIPYGFAQVILFMTFIAYPADCFPHMAASVTAATSLVRTLCAACFPLFAPRLYANMSTRWAGSMLGFISLAFIAVPWIFWRWGAWLRSKSRFAPKYV